MAVPNKSENPVDLLSAERMGLAIEDYTQENVEKYQMEAFRRTLSYAKERSAFYREHMAEVDPSSLHRLSDLKSVPVTSEEDIAGNEWRFQCINASGVDRIVTVPTTGTGGKRKRLSFTEEDQQKAIAFINRGYLTMGCRRGEKMLVYMSGNSLGSIGDLVKKSMEPLEMQIEIYGMVTDIAAAYEKLMDFRPGVVEAVPWHAAALASYGRRYGNPEREFIRSANLSADVVPDAVVSRLERLWGCTVHRHYGSTEMCIFGGVECLYHTGYHLRPVDILYEIPEPDENGMGEILITTLDRTGMPLIRYRTGDIGRFNAKVCPCGCRVSRLEKVFGRERNIVSFGRRAFCLTDIADVLYRQDETVDFGISIDRGRIIGIRVCHLPGERIDTSRMTRELLAIPGMREAVTGGNCEIRIIPEESAAFPEGYNLKKTIMFTEHRELPPAASSDSV